MSSAIQTQGFTLGIQRTASPGEYTAIGEITDFSGFDGKAAEIDVTHLLSTAKEFLMGLQDFGNFSIDVNYLPTDPGQVLLRAAKTSRDVQQFQMTLSDGSKATFSAYVLSATVKGGVDAKVDGSFDLRITGAVSFT